ncbi:hypothetical protein [Legionella oakridgensis]|nr:hypothetical protein [Legionella oakridgensis]KTD38396.1 coiled-coil protein [Legionella oakridgensis]STY21387.1 coiled-coil protein [Legionella longbeachae]
MTLFLEIAKHVLQTEIIHLRDASLTADASLVNTVLTAAGAGRDVGLSGTKRELLDILSAKIRSMADGDNDEKSLYQLKKLLAICRADAEKKSDEQGYDEGDLGPGLLNLENLVQKIYDKMVALRFHDLPRDADPLNSFRYFVAMHQAQKAVEQFKAGRLERLASHPQLTNVRALAAAKKTLIHKHLHDCIADLETLDKLHPRYQQTKCERVLEWISKLRKANEVLCREYTRLLFRPGPGLLDNLMLDATEEVKKRLQVLIKQESEVSQTPSQVM